MLLELVLTVQTAVATSVSAPQNPCADQLSEMCKISPLFCPGAYPADLTPGSRGVPCWPEATVTVNHDTQVVSRPSSVSATSTSVEHSEGAKASAEAPHPHSAAAPERATNPLARLISRWFEGR